MNIFPFNAAFPKVDLITSPSSFFSNIKHQYREYRRSGFYEDILDQGLYIYQIHRAHGKHRGLICSTAIADLKDGLVLKHEKTLASKEQQMMHLLLKRKAFVKPVLLAYHSVAKIDKILDNHIAGNDPMLDVTFKDKKERHIVWAITEKPVVAKLIKLFASVSKSYIGDGHHRTTTVALLNQSTDLGDDAKKYARLLTAYFPFSELQILDYNRVIDIAEIMSGIKFMALMSKYFVIKKVLKASKPKEKHVITMYIDEQWYKLKWRSKYIDEKKHDGLVLDSALINKYVFGKILGIEDVRVDQRIKYYSGLEPYRKIMKQVNRSELGVGFFILPVAPEELTKISDKGQVLPPKSTWFEPRLVSGIVAKDL
jgi:uncharacterized protein (DUF1015 family)